MSILESRPGFEELIASLTREGGLPGDVTGHHVVPAKLPHWGDYPEALNPRIREALAKKGITRPYSHQAEAFEAIAAGKNVVLTTPTASGKTLCFNVPILDQILREPDARALYIYPTKALSHDQYTGLHALITALDAPIRTFTFDGDTPPDARRQVRDHGHIVITNPDMLHSGVLPQHTKWLKLFRNLRYVVIDELHTYRGIFGSHVAHLIRRLRRICQFHGSDPQFIACSATIDNPGELAKGLIGDDAVLIGRSGSPTGEHHLITYNPPVVNRELHIRQGVVRASYQVARDLIVSGVSTIVFAQSRLHVEILLKYLREAMVAENLPPDLVQGYRGGYLPLRRRRVEQGLRAGTIRGIVTTNALEAGVDIGSLDACVLCGYPGSIASFWQRSGRAGRRSGKSLTVYVASSMPVDQYLVTHPDVLLGSSPESARINPRNLFVLVDHAKCAAFELPFEPDEAFGVLNTEETEEILGYLESHGVVNQSAGRFHWMARVFPAHHVSLRGISEQNFAVIEVPQDRVIAEVDFRAAHTTLHKHAIYHLDSHQYQVEELDYDNHKAYVRRVEPDYYTTAMTFNRVSVLDEDQVDHHPPFSVSHGEVLVTRKFVGFKKIRFHTNETIGYGDIHLPDLEMHTMACWFELPKPVIDALPFNRETVTDGLKALAHALKTSACVALMCAGQDLGHTVGEDASDGTPGAPGVAAGLSAAEQTRSFDPTVYIYDTMPGGVGLAAEIHARFFELVQRARGVIGGCSCGAGCPACMGGMPFYAIDLRHAAIAIADKLLAARPAAGARLPVVIEAAGAMQ